MIVKLMLNQNQVIKMPRFLFDLSLLQFIMNNQNRYTNKFLKKQKIPAGITIVVYEKRYDNVVEITPEFYKIPFSTQSRNV